MLNFLHIDRTKVDLLQRETHLTSNCAHLTSLRREFFLHRQSLVLGPEITGTFHVHLDFIDLLGVIEYLDHY